MIKFVLRPSYPKQPGLSAKTKGLCSLTFSNLKLWKDKKSCWVELSFLGKSSVPFSSKRVLPKLVYQKLEELREGKDMDDQVFDLVKSPQKGHAGKGTLGLLFSPLICGCRGTIWSLTRSLQKQYAGKEGDPSDYHFPPLILVHSSTSIPKAPTLNKFFQGICRYTESMKPTLKSIRTYCAGKLFQSKLQKIKKDEKRSMVQQYNNALQEVSKMLNHTGENTAKVNYIDPRITVAWCLKWNILITDVFTPFQRQKFQWAIEMRKTKFKFVE
ncbi:DNA topoisomerase 1-like [Ostrea edulis]|uniref:DNA topoisomerase 1-like n=1 Tax=Ostrea edulis TaxID=37623 RepID=UPI0024AF2352|nr:DNA topoisomerase 1-like [Ostrea edulis]